MPNASLCSPRRELRAPVHLSFIVDPFQEQITTKLCLSYGIYFIIICSCPHIPIFLFVICHKILNRILVAPVHLGFILDPFREHINDQIMFLSWNLFHYHLFLSDIPIFLLSFVIEF